MNKPCSGSPVRRAQAQPSAAKRSQAQPSAAQGGFAALEQVLDRRLVDQHTLASGAQLDHAAIKPLHGAVDLFAVFKHHGHLGLLLHLLLKVEGFRMRTLRDRRAIAHGMAQRVFSVHAIVASFGLGKVRTNQLPCAVKGALFGFAAAFFQGVQEECPRGGVLRGCKRNVPSFFAQ